MVLRRRFSIFFMVMTFKIFLCILLCMSWNIRWSRGRQSLLIPSTRFWKQLVWSESFWNKEQQRLEVIHNPLFNQSLHSPEPPDWLNDMGPPDPCEPDYRVRTQIKDYNTLPQHFQDFLLYMRCRTYPMLIDQPAVCNKKPFLLLVVKSLTQHFDRRQAIRETWGQAGVVANRTVATVFLLGTASPADFLPDLQGMLVHEARFHGDLLQWEFRDTFFNLTLKEVLFLEWFSRSCRHAQYVLKGDDDVFVNTFRVIEFLKDLPQNKAEDLFIGDVIRNAAPYRDQKVKYFIPKSVFNGRYPSYAGGGGYLFSGSVALRLYVMSSQVLLYPIDDVYTGMCLEKLGLTPETHSGFKTIDVDYKLTPCMYRSLMVVHSRTLRELLTIWSWIRQPELDCQ